MCAGEGKGQKKGTRSTGAGVTDGRRLQCRCWKTKSCPLQEQQALKTVELSLQPIELYFLLLLSVWIRVSGICG